MLVEIIPYIIAIALFTLIGCIFVYPAGLLAWIPSAVVTYLIISTCIVIIPAPYIPPDDSWKAPHDGSYGYTSDNHILPPGYEGFKWPWVTVDLYDYDYTYITTAIPTQTRDGMRMLYHIDTPVDTLRFNPIQFEQLYNHKLDNFRAKVISNIKPHLDQYMSHISEADFELGRMNHEALEKQMVAYYPQEGLDWNEEPEYVTYFQHIDDPQYSYACAEFPGLCAQGDAVGLKRATNEYHGQSIPYKDRNPTITPTPEPTPIYMSDGGYETQEQLNVDLDDIINNPSKYGI